MNKIIKIDKHMKIDIKATKIELSKEIRGYLQKKLDRSEKFLGRVPVINCHAEVGLAVGGQKRGKIYRAEVNLDLPGKLLRVERESEDIFKAIDKVKDHLDLLIKKYKEKKYKK